MKQLLTGTGILVLVILVYVLFFRGYPITNSDTPGETIVCFGDSLTYGTGAKKGMSYPDQLARRIGRTVINAGVPGNTTEDGLERLEEDVLAHEPDIVLITLGGNDLKNGISRDRAFENLGTIIRIIQARGALVVLAGIDIPFFGKGFGDAYKTLARETGSLLIPNIFSGIMGKSGLMSDQIHPNAKGYAIVADHFYEKIKPYIK